MDNKQTIYIRVLEEETPTLCRTQGVNVGNGLYKVLPTSNYDPEDEIWEFPPGSIVRCELVDDGEEEFLLAIQEVPEEPK